MKTRHNTALLILALASSFSIQAMHNPLLESNDEGHDTEIGVLATPQLQNNETSSSLPISSLTDNALPSSSQAPFILEPEQHDRSIMGLLRNKWANTKRFYRANKPQIKNLRNLFLINLVFANIGLAMEKGGEACELNTECFRIWDQILQLYACGTNGTSICESIKIEGVDHIKQCTNKGLCANHLQTGIFSEVLPIGSQVALGDGLARFIGHNLKPYKLFFLGIGFTIIDLTTADYSFTLGLGNAFIYAGLTALAHRSQRNSETEYDNQMNEKLQELQKKLKKIQ